MNPSSDWQNAKSVDQPSIAIYANGQNTCDHPACCIDNIGDDHVAWLPRMGSYGNLAVDVILR
jgi:hypothetical protein